MTARNGHTLGSASHASTATGAKATMPTTRATAVAASMSRRPRDEEIPERMQERRAEREREGGGRHRTASNQDAARAAPSAHGRFARQRDGEARDAAVRPARRRRRDRRGRNRGTCRAHRSRRRARRGPATSAAEPRAHHRSSSTVAFATCGSVTFAWCARHIANDACSLRSSPLTSSAGSSSSFRLRGCSFRPAFVQSGIVVYSALARSRLNWLVGPSGRGSSFRRFVSQGFDRVRSTRTRRRTTPASASRTFGQRKARVHA